jgi:FtsP/CotA-like multicopper oxidase with cupredoxin domain
MEYNPQYFLANGVSSSTGEVDVGAPGATTLIRFINMGLKTHIPTIHGGDFAVIAEDGYAYSNARNQYSVMLAAGQTKDVLFTPPQSATYAMFDRMLNLTNGSSSSGIVTAAVGGSSGSTLASPGSLVTVLGTNADADNVLDYRDNCLLVTNTNQRDTNGDGFGNMCDADLNNDGKVNLSDYSQFRSAFGKTVPDADFNGDGQVNLSDYSIFRSAFGKAPGPSGVTVN